MRRLDRLRSRASRCLSSAATLRLTVARGMPSRRAAAERLPSSTAASRIDIDSKRSIGPSEFWEDNSNTIVFIHLLEEYNLQASGRYGQRYAEPSSFGLSGDAHGRHTNLFQRRRFH